MNAKSKFDREDVETKEEKKFTKKDSRKNRKYSKSKRAKSTGETSTVDKNPRTNDVSWYANDPVLLHNAASFSFNNPLGNSLRVSELAKLPSSVSITNPEYLDTALPGLMRINYAPAIGFSKDMYSQVNIAARSIFSAVRAGLSGNWKDYAPADMMKYILAVDSLYALYAYFLRIYGLARIYAQQNRYWPRAILESMGLNVEDICSGLSDFRYYMNTYATRLNSISVPADINIFARHFMLNRTVWADGEGEKVQLYYFAPNFLYQYDELNHIPAALVPFTMPRTGESFTVAQLIDLAENLIQPLLNSEDIGIISGDFLKALGIGGLMKLPSCEIDEMTVPIPDATVLHQIHNMQFVGDAFELRDTELSFTIKELTSQDGNAGALVQGPAAHLPVSSTPMVADFTHAPCELPKLVDVHGMQEVSPEIIMEITRLIVSTTTTGEENELVVNLTSYGTEVPTSFQICTLKSDGTLEYDRGSSMIGSIDPNASKMMALVSQFNLHPILMRMNTSAQASGNLKTLNIFMTPGTPYFGDLENYTVLSKADIARLHDCALLGLFNVPKYGVYFSKKLS